MTAHFLRRLGRFVLCGALVSNQFACVSRITYDELPKIAEGIEVASTCVRLPSDRSNGEFTGYISATRETFSDQDPEEFRRRVKTANIIYRYDPYVPQAQSASLPWPYQHLTCETLSSPKTPKLPKGLWEIPLSEGIREALIASLTQPQARESPTLRTELTTGLVNKKFIGQTSGFAFGRYQPATLEEVAHMVRQSIRDALPTVKGPDDKEISIIDTVTGQVIGGAGAGTVISFVPLGALASDAVIRSGSVPAPSNPFMLGKGSAEMVWGIVQMGVGGSAAAGGGGATLTGGGAIVGVPVCVAGVALAVNGSATFLNGARTVMLAVTQWPNEAAAMAEPLPAAAGPAPAPTPAPQPAAPPPPAANHAPKPPAAPPPAVKPPPKPPAPPAATPNSSAPAPGQTTLGHTQLGSGTKSGKNTTTWVKCTGQIHHAISKTIYKFLQDHDTLKNIYAERDPRFVTQAIDKAAHRGYQQWHRGMEKQVEAWLDTYKKATPAEFEAFLRWLYKTDKELAPRFPNGL